MLTACIAKSFDGGKFSLDIDLRLSFAGGHAVFFGPSGSGKSLTMQCVTGLREPDSGQIAFRNRTLNDSARNIKVAPQKRKMGYVPQNYALFPHLTILQNVAYARSGWLGRHMGRSLRLEAANMLAAMEIAHLADYYPSQISGGQKQRAALARALFAQPELLLLDEPFSALDPLLREHTRREVARHLERLSAPALVITHDPADVDIFAGNLALFANGRAVVVKDWRRRRQDYADAAACLRALQRESFPEMRQFQENWP